MDDLERKIQMVMEQRGEVVEEDGSAGECEEADIRMKFLDERSLPKPRQSWEARLHADAQKRAMSLEKLRLAKDAKHSYQPEITAKARSLESEKDRSAMLYAQGVQKLRGRSMTLEENETKPPSGCTFTPQTNTQRRLSRRSRSASPKPVYERLNTPRSTPEAKHDPECTFRPRLISRQKSYDDQETGLDSVASLERRGPEAVAERSEVYAREKAARLEALREARRVLEAAEATFVPKRIAQSGRLGGLHDDEDDSVEEEDDDENMSQKNGSVHERLYGMSQELERKHRELREARTRTELAECTFAPAPIAKNSNPNVDETAQAWGRLLDDARDIPALREELKRQRELEGCTFKPSIKTNFNTLLKKKKYETPVHERLAAPDTRQLERGRLRTERELEGCTFTPRVGRSPRNRSRSPEVFQRMSEDDRARRARSVERQQRQQRITEMQLKDRAVRAAPAADAKRMEQLAKPRRHSELPPPPNIGNTTTTTPRGRSASLVTPPKPRSASRTAKSKETTAKNVSRISSTARSKNSNSTASRNSTTPQAKTTTAPSPRNGTTPRGPLNSTTAPSPRNGTTPRAKTAPATASTPREKTAPSPRLKSTASPRSAATQRPIDSTTAASSPRLKSANTPPRTKSTASSSPRGRPSTSNATPRAQTPTRASSRTTLSSHNTANERPQLKKKHRPSSSKKSETVSLSEKQEQNRNPTSPAPQRPLEASSEVLDDFQRWQADMEAKLAAL